MIYLIKKIIPVVLIIFLFLGCNYTNRKAPFELSESQKIIQFINLNYNLAYIDTSNMGTLFIDSYNINERFTDEQKLKFFIDKTLNILPNVTKEWNRSAHEIDNYYYNFYEWETPRTKLVLQANFFFDDDKKDKTEFKMWLDIK